ncbi:MAG TPA: hypothetical protein PLR75_05005 [Candidatus Pacearchaeota archaeon]|nr:hypothetical protein [Candidatus Pacearchaeota archaeon]
MRLKKNPLTPDGLKSDWLEILPRINAVLANYRGNEWFSKLLNISRDWTDAELKKSVPQSPELAISLVLDPLAKKDFFRLLIDTADPEMKEEIFRLREELAAFRKKIRLVKWIKVDGR